MKKLKNPLKTAGVACLAAGLVSTWDASPAHAASYEFSGEITPSTSLSDVYFLFSVGTCQPGGGVFAQEISTFLPANTVTSFDITFNSIADGLGGGDGFAIAGLYDVGNGGVSLSYDPTWATLTLEQNPAPEWNGNWLPIGGSIEYFNDESDVAASLQSGLAGGPPFDPGQSPFPGISTDPSNPSDFTMIDFSGASYGGSGSVVEVVPEPASWCALASGAIVLFSGRFLRRRHKI